MSETLIEWTDYSWNVFSGCTILSEGCTNCYAMAMAKRLERMGDQHYSGLTRISGNRIIWNGQLHFSEKALQKPYFLKKPKRIFVNSMSDTFHEKVSDENLLSLWKVMEDNNRHIFQILTKRPERMRDFLIENNIKPIKNIWLGTSVENKSSFSRVDILKSIDGYIKFISFEPLLGSVSNVDLSSIDWAIVGGESGPKARPMATEWVDDIYHACLLSGTAFFFKQWGSFGEDGIKRSKKNNGRFYKGQEWNNMPF